MKASSGSRSAHRAVGAAAMIGGLASTANAQWTVIDLHPAGEFGSAAYGVSNGQQVGIALTNFETGYLWTGTGASAVNLNFGVVVGTRAFCVEGGVQGGDADFGVPGEGSHACLWTGTPASRVDLHPSAAGVGGSQVWDLDGVAHQVGFVNTGAAGAHAALWTGTAASWVDLHPAGAMDTSEARGVHGGQQAGFVHDDALAANYAGLWTGTAASWVSLHPAGYQSSRALDVHSEQQVGEVVSPLQTVASLWNGTAASWVNLHPTGAQGSSIARAVHNGHQVGTIYPGGGSGEHACLWGGTGASFVDLHDFLPIPAGFGRSEAYGVWHDAAHTYVVGYSVNELGENHAIMWVGPLAPTVCYANCDRSTIAPVLNVQDFGCFLNKFAAGDSYANCDSSTTPPVLNVQDFGCFLNRFATGCP